MDKIYRFLKIVFMSTIGVFSDSAILVFLLLILASIISPKIVFVVMVATIMVLCWGFIIIAFGRFILDCWKRA